MFRDFEFFFNYIKKYENTPDSLNQRSWTRWGQKWNLTQMHKWYRSWWIDPHIVQEPLVKEQNCVIARNFSQKKFLSVGVKWYRSWWIDPHIVQGLLVTRLCTQWIDPQIQQIDRHPTEKWLRQKIYNKNTRKPTSFPNIENLIHHS